MGENTAACAAVVCATLWDAFVISGTAYVVFWKGHSGWWFALAVLLLNGTIDVKRMVTAKRISPASSQGGQG